MSTNVESSHEIDNTVTILPFTAKNKIPEREKEADHIIDIIRENQIANICLVAPFGAGKTFLVNMIAEKINLVDENSCGIVFNAWKYDYWQNPLLAFVEALNPVFVTNNLENKKLSDNLYNTYNALKNMLSKLSPLIKPILQM